MNQQSPTPRPQRWHKRNRGMLVVLGSFAVLGLFGACTGTALHNAGTTPAAGSYQYTGPLTSAPAPAPETTRTYPGVFVAPTFAAPAPPPPPLVPHRVLTTREWALIAKAPDSHIGERVVVYGYITQFDAATGSSGFRARVDGAKRSESYQYDTNTVLSGTATQLADVVQDDMFRAEVTVAGSFSYTTTLGGEMTVPRVTIDTIKII